MTEIFSSPLESVYDLPASTRARWGRRAMEVFEAVYDAMMFNQEMFLHQDAFFNEEDQWRTTAWNAAWVAADAVEDSRRGGNRV